MQQRARLKALDRFKADENAVLVASDVAARGLDIIICQHSNTATDICFGHTHATCAIASRMRVEVLATRDRSCAFCV